MCKYSIIYYLIEFIKKSFKFIKKLFLPNETIIIQTARVNHKNHILTTLSKVTV